jgi:UDP-N-acetylglucosamine--N-acetylmuramyl-(pentapeptide) pyrophosphoryl-undecaprenol N-acetylglucosamine transferase
MRVVIAGGGTAGHVFPAIALAKELTERHGAGVAFVGTAGGLEAELVPAAGFPLTTVEARPFERKLSLRAATAPLWALRSIGRCRPLVARADVVVGMGGYVSAPASLAAIRWRRPLVLHEQNAVPGLANRVLSRAARTVALSFGETARLLPRRIVTEVTGNPVREEILAVQPDRTAFAAEARSTLGLEAGRATVIAFGGSQGALHLDRAMTDALERLRDRSDLQVVLLTGSGHFQETERRLSRGGPLLVRALPFLDRMELAYAVADLVVSRSGATTVAEVTVCGLPSILVPYPYATGRHQEANARAVQRAGAAMVIMDDALTGELLASKVTGLLEDRPRLRAMAERASAVARPDAAQALAKVVAEAAEG